jgi:hypothetical protein
MIEIVERQKGVGITPLLAHKKASGLTCGGGQVYTVLAR